jgi:hypothetical protein
MSDERLEAGRDYQAALQRLGFPIQAILWTLPEERGIHSKAAANIEDELELGIVSTLIEREGPRIIYDLLWQAYDHAGTPKSISPWSVCLYGSLSRFGREVRNIPILDGVEVRATLVFQEQAEKARPMQPVWVSFAGRLTQNNWVYKREVGNRGTAADRRAIKAFTRNVEELKAA